MRTNDKKQYYKYWITVNANFARMGILFVLSTKPTFYRGYLPRDQNMNGKKPPAFNFKLSNRSYEPF